MKEVHSVWQILPFIREGGCAGVHWGDSSRPLSLLTS